MRILIAITAAALLSGCATGQGLLFRDAAVTRAASAYDESLANAEMWMCRGGSVGSIVRAYADRWDSWLRLCGYAGQKEMERPELPD